MLKKSLALWTLFGLFGLKLAVAQFTLRGGISGTVTDQSQAAVPNAHVVLLDLAHNQSFTAKTNSEGLYSFSNRLVDAAHFQGQIHALHLLGTKIDFG